MLVVVDEVQDGEEQDRDRLVEVDELADGGCVQDGVDVVEATFGDRDLP